MFLRSNDLGWEPGLNKQERGFSESVTSALDTFLQKNREVDNAMINQILTEFESVPGLSLNIDFPPSDPVQPLNGIDTQNQEFSEKNKDLRPERSVESRRRLIRNQKRSSSKRMDHVFQYGD